MAATFFRLFLIFLGLSHLLCLKAVPATRTENLVKEQDFRVHLITLENIPNKIIAERKWEREEATVTERMELELHDYAPSGANGRHTPRAP